VTTLHERIETSLPIEAAFAYVADFANAQAWDPGVETSERIDAGPVDVGARYRLGVHIGGHVSPMEYTISEFEPPRRVVLVGSGSGISAVDEIRFEPAGTGTRIDYSADIRLGGLLRLAQPFLRGSLAKVARKAGEGMRLTLADRARAAAVEPADPR
jgi:carbon monoxide dehydrogenase subunit G